MFVEQLYDFFFRNQKVEAIVYASTLLIAFVYAMVRHFIQGIAQETVLYEGSLISALLLLTIVVGYNLAAVQVKKKLSERSESPADSSSSPLNRATRLRTSWDPLRGRELPKEPPGLFICHSHSAGDNFGDHIESILRALEISGIETILQQDSEGTRTQNETGSLMQELAQYVSKCQELLQSALPASIKASVFLRLRDQEVHKETGVRGRGFAHLFRNRA